MFCQKLGLVKPILKQTKKVQILASFFLYVNIFVKTCIKNAQFNLFYQYMSLLAKVK